MDNLSLTIKDKETKNSINNLDINTDINTNIDYGIENNNDILWVDKYKPKCLSDMFMKKDYLNIINKWITDFQKNKIGCKNSLLLYGPPGTGKSTIARIILEEFNYDIIEFNASDVRNQKLISSKIKELIGQSNIINMMMFKPKKIAIIMDEIDGMSSGDRGGLNELIKLMYPNKKKSKLNKKFIASTPFICISNSVEEKKFNDIKKNSVVIKVAEPHAMFLNKLVKKISKGENFEIDDFTINTIVKRSQGDFRRLINLLQYIYNNKESDNDEVDALIDKFDKKNKNYTVYEGVDKILNNYIDIDKIFQIYDTDKNIIGMLLYENFVEYLVKNRKDDNKEKIKQMRKIYDNFSFSDIFDNNIYIKQSWDLYDYNGVMKCSYTSHILNNMKKYSCNKHTKLNFSNLLNKTSLEYLNYKNISIINEKLFVFNNYEILIYIGNCLLNYLFNDSTKLDKNNKGIQICNKYELDLIDIEKFLKITISKINLTSKVKKQLKLLLEKKINCFI